jgi:hypothetical protein
MPLRSTLTRGLLVGTPLALAALAVSGVSPTTVHGQPATPGQQVSATAGAPGATAADAALPDVNTVLTAVRGRLQLDRELQQQYTYLERRRDVKVSKLGKVFVGPLRTFEVYPSAKPGRTYKRLVAVDGTPLPRADLERRDAEHRAHVLAMVEQEQHETAEQKEKRQKKEAEDLREQKALIDDAFAVFDVKLTGREMLDGHRVIAGTLTPRPNAKTRTDEGKWMKKFRGRAWVSADDYQVVKVEMEAIDDISIGWGIIGRVHDGSRFTFTRTKVNEEIWLPAEAKFEASGRTLLFRKFQIFTVTSFSDYKKFDVNTDAVFDLPKDDKPKEIP